MTGTNAAAGGKMWAIVTTLLLLLTVPAAIAPEAEAVDGVGDETLWTWNIGSGVNKILTGDVDNDGYDETVAMDTTTERVYGIDEDGTSMWSFQVSDATFAAGGVGGIYDIVLADVDGDLYYEVAIGTDSGYIGVINGTLGTLVDSDNPGTSNGDFRMSAAELDGTAGEEILAVDINDDQGLYAYEVTGAGALNELWFTDTETYIQVQTGWGNYDPRYTAAADVDGDGHDEALVFTRTTWGGGSERTYAMLLDESTGNVLDYYSYLQGYDNAETRDIAVANLTTTDGEEFAVAALNSVIVFEVDAADNIGVAWDTDLTDPVRAVDIGYGDNDSLYDVVFAADNGKVTFAAGEDGAAIWSRAQLDGTQAVRYGVEAFDADGDGVDEVAVAEANSAVMVLDTSGTELWRVTGTSQGALAPADLDGDGSYELLSIGSTWGVVSAYDGIWERPSLTIKSPVDMTMVQDTILVSINDAVEPDGFGDVYLTVDGVEWGLTTDAPYSFNLDTTELDDGWHELGLLYYDVTGNYNDCSVVSILVDNLDPMRSLTSPAAGEIITGPCLVAAAASDAGSGVDHVDFYVDSELMYQDDNAPYQWSWDSSLLDDGAHIVEVQVTDSIGHTSSEQVDVTVDNLAPGVAITSPSEGVIVSGLLPVQVTATDAGTDVTKVEYYTNGARMATMIEAPYTWYWNTTGAGPGDHIISVAAWDRTGNTAGASVRVTVDNTLPTLDILEPAYGDVVKSEVSLRASVGDGYFLDEVAYTLDGDDHSADGYLVPEAVDGIYSYVIDSTALENGDYTLTVTAYGATGWQVSDQTGFTVDNTVYISYPQTGLLLEGGLNLVAVTNGGAEIEGLTVSVDDAEAGPMYQTGENTYGYYIDTALLADGTHTVTVDAVGAYGAIGTDSVMINVDNSYPVITLEYPLEGAYMKGEFTVSAPVTDTPGTAGVHVEYSVDGRAWTAMDVPVDTTVLNDGDHTIFLRAYDLIGHTTYGSVDFITDNTAPAVRVIGPGYVHALDEGFRLEVALDEEYGPSAVTANVSGVDPEYRTLTLDGESGLWYLDLYMDEFPAGAGFADVTVTAYDYAGSYGADDHIVDFGYDVTAPEITITAPLDGSVQTGVFSLEASVYDEYGPLTVSARVGAGTESLTMTRDLSTGYYVADYDTSEWDAGDGPSTLTITARDVSGNTAQATVDIVADNTAPAVTVLHELIQDGHITYMVSVADAYSDVEYVMIRVGSGEWKEMSVTPEGDYEYGWKDTVYEDNGVYSYEVRVVDSQGNDATYSDELEVSNPEDFTVYYVAAAVIAVIVLVVLALYLRRRKKAKEEDWDDMDEAPGAPKAGTVSSVPMATAVPPGSQGDRDKGRRAAPAARAEL